MSRIKVEWLLGFCVALGCSGKVQDRHVSERAVGGSESVGATAAGGTGSAQGGVSGAAAPPGVGAPGAGAPAAGASACDLTANPTPLRALSSWEYRRSVAALTGHAVSAALPPDQPEGPFAFSMSLDSVTVEAVFAEAEAQAAAVALAEVVPCDLSAVSGDCAHDFVFDWVGRAWRRTPSPAEINRYVNLFKLGSNNGDFAAGLRLVIEAALISPLFLHKLYLGEGTDPNAGTELTGLELGSRLSLLLTGEPPDADLWNVAEAGFPLKTTELEAEARRLMSTPAFIAAVQHFHEQWLGLDGLSSRAEPELSPDLLDSMRGESLHFVAYIFQGSRRLPEFLVTPQTFVDWRLAPRYGLSVPEGDFVRVDLDPTRYVGVLTQSGLLTRFKNPTQRGKFVRERLLCNVIPPPPPSIPPLAEILPGQTRRQAWEQHQGQAVCMGCHQLMDPIGFGFEHFDDVGVYQETDNGLPVDVSGQIAQGGDAEGPFVGVVELADRLSKSEAVSKCMTRQWFGYALQRSLVDSDACQVDAIHAAFRAADWDMGELLVAIVKSQAFSHRDAYAMPDVPLPAAPSGVAGDEAARRKLVLDFSLGEATWLTQVVPPEDRPRVEQFMTALRDLEIKLSQVGPGGPPQP